MAKTMTNGLYSDDGDVLVACDRLYRGTFEVPHGVTTIAEDAFKDCNGVETIVFSDTVTQISGFGIANCKSVKSVVLPQSLSHFGACAFDGCSSLESIVLPESITVISALAFNGCENLTYVSVPSGLQSIGVSAFQNCTSLRHLFLPSSITNINPDIITGCNEDFTFYCEGEKKKDWQRGWRRLGPDPKAKRAEVQENVPRWWYEKFIAQIK